MNTQRQYWEQWNNMQQQAMGVKQPPKNPWEQSLEHWWSAVQGAVPSTGQDFFSKMMDQGKAYFQMAEQAMQAANGQENISEAWSKMLHGLTESFQQTQTNDPFKQASSFWEMPLDNWNRMASAMSPVPGDTLRGMPHGDVKEHLDRLLGTPGLGYTRESQSQYQSLLKAVMDYQEAMTEYALFFSSMGEKSAKLLQQKVSDTPVESARQLYDTWVGCCEEMYAEDVTTEDYAKLHGRLVNALMVMKSRYGEILNESLSTMNIPTHDDLRTVQIRMQEQRRENKKLASEVAALRREIQKMQAVKKSADTKPAAQAAAKKVTKKKAAPRKKKAAAPRRTTN